MGAARERPKEFSALIVLGALLLLVVALAGRNPTTHTMVAAYLILVAVAILRQAVRRAG